MAYFEAVTALGMRLLRLLALALNMEPDFFLPMFQQPMLFLRPLHYIPRRSQPDQVLLAASSALAWRLTVTRMAVPVSSEHSCTILAETLV